MAGDTANVEKNQRRRSAFRSRRRRRRRAEDEEEKGRGGRGRRSSSHARTLVIFSWIFGSIRFIIALSCLFGPHS